MLYTQETTANLPQQRFAYLEIEEGKQVLTVTLNRPHKKNALNPVMINELAFALSYARHHHHIWAVVLRARGDVFCAGADLKALAGGEHDSESTIPAPEGEVLIGELFNKLGKPCIAQLTGDVYAGGFLLLTGCTYVVAQTGIRLGLPEVKRGLFPFQVMAGLLEVMPPRRVLDWCIRGYDLPAEQAYEWGLITHLTAPEETEAVVQQLLDDILANSPTAIRLGLEAYDHIRSGGDSARHQYLRDMLMRCLQTRDAMEGITAFREKRAPKWTGT